MTSEFLPTTTVRAREAWTLDIAIEQVGACPLCRHHLLKPDDRLLACRSCGAEFPIRHGIPCMEVGERSKALALEEEWYGQTTEPERIDERPPALSEGHHLAHDKARRGILEALRNLGATDAWTVLSIATGDGLEIPLIEQVSRRIVGIDLALPALRKFSARFPYPVFQGNVRSLPFRDLAFDACVVSGLLHHIVGYDDMVPYLAEFRRVLRKGGVLLVLEPNSLYPVQWVLGPVNRIVQRVRPGWRGLVPHERPISPGFIMRRLRDARFVDVQYSGTTFLHNRLPARICRVVDPLEDRIRARAPFRLFAWWTLVKASRSAA